MAKQGPTYQEHIDGLELDCSNSSALAMGLLQSCTKLLIYMHIFVNKKSSKGRHMPLPKGPQQVELPIRQVDSGQVFNSKCELSVLKPQNVKTLYQ